MATPRLSGTAMTSATSDVTSVPAMNGSAPNTSATGSQTAVVRKPSPKAWREQDRVLPQLHADGDHQRQHGQRMQPH